MQRCWAPVVQLYCKLHAGIPCPSPSSTTIFRSESGLYQFLSQWVAIEVSFLKITKLFELLWHKWELSFIIYSTIGCSWESKTLNSGPWPEGIAHIPPHTLSMAIKLPYSSVESTAHPWPGAPEALRYSQHHKLLLEEPKLFSMSVGDICKYFLLEK